MVGFPGSEEISNADVLETECEILVPAALENQITRHNAHRIKAKIVAEAANGPTTPEADEILHDHGVFLIPDILQRRGVTVSYFEWVQDMQSFFWTEQRINESLKEIMDRAFNSVHAMSKLHEVDMRTAAYMVAVARVAEATTLRGAVPIAEEPSVLDHEERFLFREEILNLANALTEPGALDNVEDLLAEVTTSPRFDSDVFTLERSLQVMLGNRAGSTLVGLLTVTREVFEEVGEIGMPPDVHERIVSWRARFGLAIDNALNFLNNPDGIQGHNFGTQVLHGEGGTTLQGRLTLVRFNNEPQFFIADAEILLAIAADMMDRLGEHLDPEQLDPELVQRLREGLERIERRSKARE